MSQFFDHYGVEIVVFFNEKIGNSRQLVEIRATP